MPAYQWFCRVTTYKLYMIKGLMRLATSICNAHMHHVLNFVFPFFPFCFSMFWIADLPFFAEAMAECLGSHDDFGKLWRASGRDHMASCIPSIIHEDGVPHFSGIWACMHQLRSFWDSTATYHDNNSWLVLCEAAPLRFGAGALDVSGMIPGKADTLSPSWALRR